MKRLTLAVLIVVSISGAVLPANAGITEDWNDSWWCMFAGAIPERIQYCISVGAYSE